MLFIWSGGSAFVFCHWDFCSGRSGKFAQKTPGGGSGQDRGWEGRAQQQNAWLQRAELLPTEKETIMRAKQHQGSFCATKLPAQQVISSRFSFGPPRRFQRTVVCGCTKTQSCVLPNLCSQHSGLGAAGVSGSCILPQEPPCDC